MPQKLQLLGSLKGKKEFGGKCRPMKDMGMMKPDRISGLGMKLESGTPCLAHKGVLVGSRPFHREIFFCCDSFHFCAAVGSKHIRPSLEGSHISSEAFRTLAFMSATIADPLGCQLGAKFLWDILIYLSEIRES